MIPLIESNDLKKSLSELNSVHNGLINSLLDSNDLDASTGKVSLLQTPSAASKRLIFIGLGKTPDLVTYRKAMISLQAQLVKLPISNATIITEGIARRGLSAEQVIQQTSLLIESGFYQYDTTLSKKAAKQTLKRITLLDADNTANKAALAQGAAIGQGINLTKQLSNLPANFCTPRFLAKQAQDLAKKHTELSCEILDEAQLKKLKMHSLLSVTAGTDEPAKFIIMEYKGGKQGEQPTVLVGKGVTFDSGGISLKPGAAMDEMKYDMCGAASVFGTLEAIATLNAKVNIIGVIAAVENMPSGGATKPGDVITSMSGQTIEVLNTDAEGRLVLCDALTYVERFKPRAVIDIATLTGAAIVALGKHATALYSNHEPLSKSLLKAGDETHDRAWPMPLWEDYNQQLSSNFADIANIGGPQGGSVTAACFLSRFTEKYHWAHLDIAGPAWESGAKKGATGRPVSLLVQYLLDNA